METFIKNLARGAGKILREGLKRKKQIIKKSEVSYDIVTEYDLRVERFICDRIRKKFSNHTFLGEELSARAKPSKNFWIIDPIDGTSAFARGLPEFSISIAYVSDDVIQEGVVYNPVLDYLFYARTGKGATLNNYRIHPSARIELAGALVAYSWNDKVVSPQNASSVLKILLQNNILPAVLCSTALHGAYTASGAVDAMIDLKANPWDYAGGAIIMQEAGAKVTQIDGKPYRWDSDTLVAANPVLHKKIITALNR